MDGVSKNLAVLIFLVYYSSQVETQDQGVHLQLLGGTRVPNHGFVGRGEIRNRNGSINNPLLCVTPDNITCCSTTEIGGVPLGNWYFPNGTEVPTNDTGWLFYTTRGPGVVHLHRRTGGVSGIYRCEIPDLSGVNQTLYVGLYAISIQESGQILLQDELEFQLMSLEPITDPPTFTLTCVTTGGPPTTVTWTRDNTEIDYQSNGNFTFSQRVTNFVSSTYNNTLTVNGRHLGQYNMTAWNRNTVLYISNQVATSAISVTAAAPATHLTAVQGSDPTTVKVSWTAPVSGDSVTGYRIYYQTEGHQGSVDVGATATQHVLTGLYGGRNYSIYLVALSAQLPSPVVGPAVVTLFIANSSTSTTSPNVTASPEVTTDSTLSTTPDSTRVLTGAIIAGVVGAVVLLVLLMFVMCISLICLRKYRGETKQKSSPQELEVVILDKDPEVVSTNSAGGKLVRSTVMETKGKTEKKEAVKAENKTKSPTNVAEKDEMKIRDIAVVIEEFPQNTKHVTEGESVLLHVKVTGAPKPTLVWYFEGKELRPDYSIDVAEEDGSVSIPSAETRHAGVYKLVATNTAGSVEREVKLFVHKEGEDTSGVVDKKVLKPVPVAEFGKYVEEHHADGNKQFRKQYKCLPKEGDGCSVAVGTKPENMPRNKFKNIIVYDDSRVILRPLPGHDDCQHDYINASYVDGYSLPRKFIATQAPISNTVIDFWRLVWQEKCPSIVMLTNLVEGGKVKCLQYWPDSDSKNYGPFEVTVTDKQMFADYSIRVFQIELSGSTDPPLKVTQFHFTAWPDHGVPDYATPILAFHRRVKSQHDSAKGPLLVHCSAGVGRTGTLITIDSVLENVKKDGMVDIAGTVNKIRQKRMNMVQTVEQYIFIHDAILESVTCGDTQIVASDLQDALEKLQMGPQSGPTGLVSQFQVLDQVTLKPGDVCRDCAVQFGEKNRNMDYLPADHWRVILKGEYPDYINAVFVNGYKQQKAFIIAQGPMESTCRDFWKMVHDRRCGGIVMLSRLREEGKEVCYQYWPSSGNQQYGEYSVDLLGEEELEGHIIRTLNITHSMSGKIHQVTQFHIMNWDPDGRCSNLNTITDVIEEVTKVQRRTSTHPIVVHCSDTVSRSGMFCAIATTIERCKTEGVVDIFQVVKALRVQKPGAILNVEQYQMVFEAVLAYLGSFDTYANFQNI